MIIYNIQLILQVRQPKSKRLKTLQREKLAAMKNIKSHKVSLRNYMIRIGCLSERHDRRAQKEGFADKQCDSDDGLFDEEDSTSMVPPSVNSNRNSLSADALRQFRKNLPSTNFDNTSASKLSYASRGPLSKNQMVVGSRPTSHLRLEL